MAKGALRVPRNTRLKTSLKIGKMLGKARAKAEGWLGQRQAIVKNLTELRDTASKLLVLRPGA